MTKTVLTRWILLLALVVCPANKAWSFDRTHHLLSVELAKYADDTGVHYAQWKKHPRGLDRYLRSLSKLSAQQYEKLPANDKAALWLNAYVALTTKMILNNYPIWGDKPHYPHNSIRQIPGCWETDFAQIGGRKLNCWQMYHDVIRKDIKDVRMHFAISCGSKGCCTQRSAYVGNKLDQELDDAMHTYLGKKDNIELDIANKKIFVAQVFKWFPLDFAPEAGFQKFPFPPPTDDEIVLGFLRNHGPEAVQNALTGVSNRAEFKVVYRDFDWTINDADAQPAKAADAIGTANP